MGFGEDIGRKGARNKCNVKGRSRAVSRGEESGGKRGYSVRKRNGVTSERAMNARANGLFPSHSSALIFSASFRLPLSAPALTRAAPSIHTADMCDVRAPFTQRFHYALCVMMRNMNYADCLKVWLQKKRFHGASVNATQFNIACLL